MINLESIYYDDLIDVHVNHDYKFIFVKWFRHPTSEEFRHLFKKLAILTLELEIEYWLSDAQAIHYLDVGDQNWIVTEIAPMFRNTRLRRFARITTQNTLELLDAVQIISRVEKLKQLDIHTQFELFTNKQMALLWLFPNQTL